MFVPRQNTALQHVHCISQIPTAVPSGLWSVSSPANWLLLHISTLAALDDGVLALFPLDPVLGRRAQVGALQHPPCRPCLPSTPLACLQVRVLDQREKGSRVLEYGIKRRAAGCWSMA